MCVTPITRIWIQPKFKFFHTKSNTLLRVYKDNGITKIKYMSHQIFPKSMYNSVKTECTQGPLLILIFHIFLLNGMDQE